MSGADPEAFRRELASRNWGLLTDEDQRLLRETRFVIAGCGSTGGACAMPLLRTGAERFVLLDPGAYELSNLNRQDATLADVGLNKARATGARLRAVSPYAEIDVHEEGVEVRTIAGLLRPNDLVIDAVDVTTPDGVAAKLALHEAACASRVPVITAYDIATVQLIELFDYRRVRRPLEGRVGGARDPEAVLRRLIPPLALPRAIFPVLIRRRRELDLPFPQLAMTSTLLGALVVPYVLRILRGEPVPRRLRVDLDELVRTRPERWAERARRLAALIPTWWRMR